MHKIMKKYPLKPKPLENEKEIYNRSKGNVSYERYLRSRNIICDEYISYLESELNNANNELDEIRIRKALVTAQAAQLDAAQEEIRALRKKIDNVITMCKEFLAYGDDAGFVEKNILEELEGKQ